MHKQYPVTVTLIALNVIAFAILALQQQSLLMNSGADVIAILNAGANLNPFTLGGQPWRLFTCMFLHFGIIHLLVNMYAMWGLGTALEPGIGSVRFTIVYFICGVVASIASLLFNVYSISAGASGAIFGLYGYRLGAELIGSFDDREKLKNVVINFVIFIVINTVIAGQVNVDMSGHIGGAVAGLIVAACHFKLGWLKQNLHLAAVLIALPFTMLFISKDQLHYYEIFQRVVKQEEYADNLYKDSKDDFALADSLKQVRTEWNAIRTALTSLTSLPSAITTDTATLNKYISLREQEVNYRITLLENQSYIYLDSLEVLPPKFDSLQKLRYILNYNIPKQKDIVDDTVQRAAPVLETSRVFYDKEWKEISDPLSASYYRIGNKDSLGRWQGAVKDFYRDGSIQMKGVYLNDLRHGVFIYYSDHGTYSSAGRYDKEQAVGKWENFHWNGKLQSEIVYSQETFVKNLWDSLGNAMVTNGVGKFKRWHLNGTLAEEGSYEGGRREGYWYGYHSNGKPYFQELYRDNRLVKGVSEGVDGKRYVYDQLSEFPFPEKGMDNFKKYIAENIRKPNDVNAASGMVKVVFNVGVDGTLWDFVIMQGLTRACDEEAIRLIKAGPAWRPALLHGNTKVQSQGYVEVVF
jgi:membrane associated rhomboid family serine protease